MKKFDFRLKSILRLRHFKEEKVKAEMGEIVSQMNTIRDDIITINKDIDEAYVINRQQINQQIGASIINFFGYYVEGKRNHIIEKEKQLAKLQKDYELKMMELSKAMGDVKVMESIRNKEKEKFKKEYNKKEQENIEELLRMRIDIG